MKRKKGAWVLYDISPKARAIAKRDSKEQEIKIGNWVNKIIIQSANDPCEIEKKLTRSFWKKIFGV